MFTLIEVTQAKLVIFPDGTRTQIQDSTLYRADRTHRSQEHQQDKATTEVRVQVEVLVRQHGEQAETLETGPLPWRNPLTPNEQTDESNRMAWWLGRLPNGARGSGPSKGWKKEPSWSALQTGIAKQ